MTESHPFFSPKAHGFVRVAAASPAVHVGDPKANAGEHLALIRQAVATPLLHIGPTRDLPLFDGLEAAFADASAAGIPGLVPVGASAAPLAGVGAAWAVRGQYRLCTHLSGHSAAVRQ